MSKEKSRCPYDEPDCFNCPFDDCKASLIDINRQQAVQTRKEKAKRDKEIISLYLQGTSMSGLAERYLMDPANVRRILKQAGIDFKEVERLRRICQKRK